MASQQAQAPPPDESAQSAQVPVVAADGERLSLEQMTRIMDVAATLRKERDVVEQQLNLDQIKAKLREKMLEAARVSGDPTTPEEIDAAIEQYYDQLHKFHEPRLGLRTFFAHLWVRRRGIFKFLFGLAAAYLLIWGLLTSGMLPGAARNRQVMQAIERDAAAVQEINLDGTVKGELDTLVASAKAAVEQGDGAKLSELAVQIAALQADLESQYTVVIASGPDEQSGLERKWTDDAGTRTSGYYVIVEARDANGQPVKVPIVSRENQKTGAVEMASRWAEQVPEEVFNRLAADKQADGVLDQKLFGVKERGSRAVEVKLTDASGAPLARQGQITAW